MTGGTILEAREVRKVFPLRGAARRGQELVAVDAVSFALPRGGALAIVGESGSGKTTLARMIVGLEAPTSGEIWFDGSPRQYSRRAAHRRQQAREIQMVFQDPYSSLDPRQSATQCLEELLRLHFTFTAEQIEERIAELGGQVGLGQAEMNAKPERLSGGQRQRVAIARALAVQPQVLVFDEALSALDVSVQAQLLNTLSDIKDRSDLTYVFVSHDLAVVRQITEQVLVMQRGHVVETGATAQVLSAPQHPYTRLLRSSVPGPGWRPKRLDHEPSSREPQDHGEAN